ncbi:acetoacetate decarboxylase family protein [Nocardia sp. NPDC051570]|uniref:acetoacetate decarboxylase family protein n=1 Tax=Nocardia sp. NPDC051570 TaxID=3364324 RepID=UPI003791BE9C
MATIYGKLTKDRFAPTMPVHTPVTRSKSSPIEYRDVDSLTFSYRTDAQTVAEIVPSVLELDENPVATLSFLSYGFSTAGAYREVVHAVGCRFQGRELSYALHVFVTSDLALVRGREIMGYPKLFADINFDPKRVGYDGLITASMERPTGLLLATGQFQASDRIEGLPEPTVRLNVKPTISKLPGQPPVSFAVVPASVETTAGERWAGTGSVKLTGLSDFSPLHRAPVVESLGAVLLRDGAMRLASTTEAYPL